MFAKLFGPDNDQVMVLLDQNQDNGKPELRFHWMPPKLGVCTVAFTAKDDTNESWDTMEKNLHKLTEADARKFIESTTKDLGL